MNSSQAEALRDWAARWKVAGADGSVSPRTAAKDRHAAGTQKSGRCLRVLPPPSQARANLRVGRAATLAEESRPVISLFQLAERVQALCLGHGWRFCFIGGVALQRWGEPRVTADVDLTLLTGFGGEEGFVDELLRHFAPRIPDAKQFALLNRVLLLESADGIGIDVARAGCRSRCWSSPGRRRSSFCRGLSLLTCSAEDLVVLKAFADRPRDWEDVQGIVGRQTLLDCATWRRNYGLWRRRKSHRIFWSGSSSFDAANDGRNTRPPHVPQPPPVRRRPASHRATGPHRGAGRCGSWKWPRFSGGCFGRAGRPCCSSRSPAAASPCSATCSARSSACGTCSATRSSVWSNSWHCRSIRPT